MTQDLKFAAKNIQLIATQAIKSIQELYLNSQDSGNSKLVTENLSSRNSENSEWLFSEHPNLGQFDSTHLVTSASTTKSPESPKPTKIHESFLDRPDKIDDDIPGNL